ncbi:hypothetical protein [Corynebacterium cystitidis]|uniref:hypothetical protein n=1 Tax=Corynebacterium cystitidis TaxID=35757 RepID=UPI00211E0BF9|nr:hypothetical protein [Corynebacterium cystitidis]
MWLPRAGDLAGRLLIPGIALYLDHYDRDGVRLLGFGRQGRQGRQDRQDINYSAFIRRSLQSTLDDEQLSSATTDPASLSEIINAVVGTELVMYFALARVLGGFDNGSIPLEEYPAGSHGPEGWPV